MASFAAPKGRQRSAERSAGNVNSTNAVKAQGWIAMCVCVLAAILKKEPQLPQSLHSILQNARARLENMPLNQLTTLSEKYEQQIMTRLMLWDL
jgi:hypothetical protein